MPLSHTAVNDHIGVNFENSEWTAVTPVSPAYVSDGKTTMELIQGEVGENGDIVTMTDSIPVATAEMTGNTVALVLTDGTEVTLPELLIVE